MTAIASKDQTAMSSALTTQISAQLQAIEQNTAAIIADDHLICSALLPLLFQYSIADLCINFINWSYYYPSATNLLLSSVARSAQPDLYNHVADALLLSLPSWNKDKDCSIGAGRVLSAAFNKFTGYIRDFVADREEVYIQHNLKPGIDYQKLGTLDDGEKWDDKEQLPELDSTRSIKCLLRQQGIPCGELDETWDEKAKRGLAYFQLLNNIKVTGELDDNTMSTLKKVRTEVIEDK